MASKQKKAATPAKKIYDYSGLEKGMRVQVESDGAWFAATVLQVSGAKNRTAAPVKISYVGYAGYDEWLGGDRLRSKALKVQKPPKPYRKVQCVAWEISTRPTGMRTHWTGDDFYKGIWGKDKTGPCWEDVKQRVAIFGEALAAAAACDKIDKDPETLKVFMAPEFLLRGPRGAYKLQALVGSAKEPGLFAELSNLVKGDAWKHWVVVFGTVVGYMEEPSGGSFPCYNCACVQLGGWNTEKERNQGAVAIMKQYKSGIDFLENPEDFYAKGLEEVQHMNFDTANTLVGFQELDRDGVFELGGVTFGVEICLDHAMQRLKQTGMDPSTGFPQVHLVPSCGMSFQFGSISVPKGGICFGCDGLADGYDGQEYRGASTHSQVYTVPSTFHERFQQQFSVPKGKGQNTELKKRYLEEMPKIAQVPSHKDWKSTLGELYDVSVKVEPQISVYASLLLPPKKK
jgi:hypothetical protein